MLEGLKNFYFKELQPLPQSAEATGVWPFTGNPRKWIDPTHPDYAPSIYADRPSIDITGSGVIKPIGGVAKGIASKLKGKLLKRGDIIETPYGKAKYDGLQPGFMEIPDSHMYTFQEGIAKDGSFISKTQKPEDVAKAGKQVIDTWAEHVTGKPLKSPIDFETFKNMTGIQDDIAVKEVWKDFQAFSKDKSLPGTEMFEAWMTKHRVIQNMLKPETGKFLKKEGLIKDELDALVKEADNLIK